MGKKGIKCWSEKEKRIIKTLIAFIVLGSLSYAENLENGAYDNLTDGTYKNEVEIGKNTGNGTIHSKGDKETYNYNFEDNVTVNGTKLDSSTSVISNNGKNNMNITLEKDKTATIYDNAGNTITATSENENDRKQININDKNNKNGNLIFYKDNSSKNDSKTSASNPYGATISADNADVNIFAESYKNFNNSGIETSNNGKVNIELSGDFESVAGFQENNNYNDFKEDYGIKNTDGTVKISANTIKMSTHNRLIYNNKNNYAIPDKGEGKVHLEANDIYLSYLDSKNNVREQINTGWNRETNIYGKNIVSIVSTRKDNERFYIQNGGKTDIISENILHMDKVDLTTLGGIMTLQGKTISLNDILGFNSGGKINIEGNTLEANYLHITTTGESSKTNIKTDVLTTINSNFAANQKAELTIDANRNKMIQTRFVGNMDLISASGNGKVNILSSKNIMEGKIISTGTLSEVNIKFDGDFDETGVKSSFLGCTTTKPDNIINTEAGKINLEFSNGAEWNIFDNTLDTGYMITDATNISDVTNLTLNNGVINFNYEDKDRKIQERAYDLVINNLKGNGGTFIIGASGNDINHEKNLYKKETDFIDIKNADGKQTHFIQLAENSMDKIISHDFEDGKKGIWFADADENVTFEGKELETLSSIYDYDIILDKNLEGRDPSKNGNNWYIKDLVEKENETVASAKQNMAFLYQTAISRLEVDSMHERMGEIRNYENTNGVWFRTSSGKMNADDFGNDYNLIQVGYDRQKDTETGKTFTGVAVNRRQNKIDLTSGDGESENIGVSFYKSFAGDNGIYFDALAKTTYIDTDYKISNGTEDMKADYNTWAETLSMEVGKKYSSKTDKWYVTPHAQINYSFIKGADYTTSTDIKVKQGDINSLIGKLGVYAGKDFEKSSHYIKVAGLYEALGDYKIDMNDKMGSKPYSEKFDGKDSWAEIGIGGTFQVGKSGTTYMYYDVERTIGSEFETQWEATLGIRMTF